MTTKLETNKERIAWCDDALATWTSINTKLRRINNEKEAEVLLDYELVHKSRWPYLLRCFARFNKLRGQRERQELKSQANKISKLKDA